MTLINLVLKVSILVLSLRDTYGALDTPDLRELGQSSKLTSRISRSHEEDVKAKAQRRSVTRQRIGSASRRSDVRAALTTLLVWNVCTMLEPLCDKTLSWVVPFYESIKTLFLMWILFTRSMGSMMLFYRYVVPSVRPYEPYIDVLIHAVASLLPYSTRLLGRLPIYAKGLYGNWSHHAADNVAAASSNAGQEGDESRQPAAKGPRAPPPAKVLPDTASSAFHGSTKPKAHRKAPSALEKSRAMAKRQLQHVDDEGAVQIDSRRIPTSVSRAGDSRPVQQREPLAEISSLKGEAAGDVAKTDQIPSPPTALRNFAFIPPKPATQSAPSTAATLLSPPPKLPGHFNFASIPPGFQQSATATPDADIPQIVPAQQVRYGQRTNENSVLLDPEPTAMARTAVGDASPTEVKAETTWNGAAQEDHLIVAPPSRRTRTVAASATALPSRPLRSSRSVQSIREESTARGARREGPSGGLSERLPANAAARMSKGANQLTTRATMRAPQRQGTKRKLDDEGEREGHLDEPDVAIQKDAGSRARAKLAGGQTTDTIEALKSNTRASPRKKVRSMQIETGTTAPARQTTGSVRRHPIDKAAGSTQRSSTTTVKSKTAIPAGSASTTSAALRAGRNTSGAGKGTARMTRSRSKADVS